MPEPKVKRVRFSDVKLNDEQGSLTALFAPFLRVDLDGDVVLPGAFGNQKAIISAYGHASWSGGMDGLPVGKGRIYDGKQGGIFDGNFFLDMINGEQTYKAVKNVGELQEYSYALPEIDSEMRMIGNLRQDFPELDAQGHEDDEIVRVLKKIRVPEVSPVLMGASIGTSTLGIKTALKRAFGSHSTGTDDRAWDAGANEKRVKKDQARSYYAKIYAYYDPDGEVGNKSTYKFIHHFIGSGGEPGVASTRACSNGIAILNGGRGGTNIPDADRQGVWRHLAKHLRDADMEPPELRSLDADGKRMPLRDHIEVLLADAAEVIERLEEVSEQRAEEDRHPSESTIKRMALIKLVLADLVGRLEQVQSKHDDLFREFLRFQKTIAERRDRDASCKVS